MLIEYDQVEYPLKRVFGKWVNDTNFSLSELNFKRFFANCLVSHFLDIFCFWADKYILNNNKSTTLEIILYSSSICDPEKYLWLVSPFPKFKKKIQGRVKEIFQGWTCSSTKLSLPI